MRRAILIFFISAFFISSIWFLALSDGTVEIVRNWLIDQSEINNLQQEISVLELEDKKNKLEASILEYTIKKKAYRCQLKYMVSKGF